MDTQSEIVTGEAKINTHFTLAITAVIISCFTGFWTMPLSLAALILALRSQDLVQSSRLEEAKQAAWWVALFGWLTIAIALIPVLLIVFFGGAILAFLGALISAA